MPYDGQFHEGVPGFTLVCPGFRAAPSAASDAGAPGTLAFTIGSQLVAEFEQGDLLESWAAAEELSAAEAAELSDEAGRHLSEVLEAGLPAADLPEAVTDAAVVLLLAMLRHGISDPYRIPACTVVWQAGGRERVSIAA